MSDKKYRRLQSQTERDMEGLAARRDRDREAAPVELPEEITGQHEGEELAELRALRPVPDRLGRLEAKHDEFRTEVDKRLNAVEVAVAGVGGKMEIIPELVDAMKDATRSLREREHITLTSKVEVETAQKLSEVKVGEAKQLDAVDAAKARRTLKLKAAVGALGLFGSGGVVFELLHKLGVL